MDKNVRSGGILGALIIIIFVVGGYWATRPPERRAEPEMTPQQREAVQKARELAAKRHAELEAAKKPDLEVLSWDWARGRFGNKIIEGKIRNNTEKTYTYVQITFDLFNDDKERVGSALANVNSLKPGEVWAFEAGVLHDQASRARVGEITGF